MLFQSVKVTPSHASPPQASRVEDVYRLEDLAPDDFLAHMEESATAILTAQQELDPK